MVHTSRHNIFKKVTISVALAGTFAFASFITDFDSNIASAAQEYNQILKVGSRGAEVTKLQKALTEQNYFSSKVDGIYGSLTKNSVLQFQRKHNLQADGIAGPQTLSKLYGSTQTAAAPKQTTTSTVLRNGSRGQAVNDLQSQLKKLNYLNSKVDGIYGSQTASAVRAFQRDNGLAVDGIAGPQTFAALKNPVKSSVAKSQVKSNIIANTSALVKTAKQHVGVPYVWGGTSPKGFDCSGFINYVFNKHGVSLPRTVASLWSSGTKVSSPKVGDIVFFNTTGGASHAGIYIGNNQFIHAGTSTGVTITSLNNSYWKPRYLGAKQVY